MNAIHMQIFHSSKPSMKSPVMQLSWFTHGIFIFSYMGDVSVILLDFSDLAIPCLKTHERFLKTHWAWQLAIATYDTL